MEAETTIEAPRSPCGVFAKVSETSSYSSLGWCEAGMSGAHLVTDRRWYCDACQWVSGRSSKGTSPVGAHARLDANGAHFPLRAFPAGPRGTL